VTYTGKLSGERWRPTWRVSEARASEKRLGGFGQARSDVLFPRASTDGGHVVSARVQWLGGRMALTVRPNAGLNTTDRWAARLNFPTRK
jgi:hypothetical protein